MPAVTVRGESDESLKRANCSGGSVGVQAQEAEKRERERGSSSEFDASLHVNGNQSDLR
jgi:hypothetical protein